MEIWKKNLLESYDNQLGRIRQEKLGLKKRLQELDELENNTLSERKNAGIKKYLDENKRNNILNEAEKLGFSHEAIEKLRDIARDWNQDNVSNDIIDEFVNLESYIENQAPHKKNPLYRLGDMLNFSGGDEDVD